ncbi:NAD-dependent epimerase/dehydratase family protein [Candidatus Margulisiibacteriota bacterium]
MAKNDIVMVTGGAGYIGAVLVKELLAKGEKVRVFDTLYFGKEALSDVEKQIDIIKGDVRQFPADTLDGVKAVIHLGSLSNDPTAAFDPKANHEINCEGTMRVAEACKKKSVSRMTLASSAAIFGFHIDGIADEGFPANPQSEYAQSKLDAENGIKDLADDKFCPVILRQATVGGLSPRMRWDLVVNTMTKDAYAKKKIYVYCEGDNWRPLVHVKDVALAHMKCIEAPAEKVKGQIFNLVQDNHKILDLGYGVAEALKDRLKVEVEVLRGPKETRSYRVSGEKMKKVLSFTPKVSVSDAAKEIHDVLQSGKYTDFENPIYYNIDWMKQLVQKGLKL